MRDHYFHLPLLLYHFLTSPHYYCTVSFNSQLYLYSMWYVFVWKLKDYVSCDGSVCIAELYRTVKRIGFQNAIQYRIELHNYITLDNACPQSNRT